MSFKWAMSIVYPSGDCKHAELQEDKRSASRGQRYKDTLKVTLCNHKRSHRGSQGMAKADSERCCRELKSYSRRRTQTQTEEICPSHKHVAVALSSHKISHGGSVDLNPTTWQPWRRGHHPMDGRAACISESALYCGLIHFTAAKLWYSLL